MAEKHVAPSLGAESFNCPHCGAFAHQSWIRFNYLRYERDARPQVLDKDIFDKFEREAALSNEEAQQTIKWGRKMLSMRPFLHFSPDRPNSDRTFEGLFASECFSCKELTLWLYEAIIYPASKYDVEPNADLSDEVRIDFEEAAFIVDKSPRGAAALLRLGLQKLVTELGGKGDNINNDIAELVKKGLPFQIQQALDIVRVIGNNAVHPGEINLKDDRDTALRLFDLINLIANVMITQPKQVKAMYESLPAGAREGIGRRDKPKGP